MHASITCYGFEVLFCKIWLVCVKVSFRTSNSFLIEFTQLQCAFRGPKTCPVSSLLVNCCFSFHFLITLTCRGRWPPTLSLREFFLSTVAYCCSRGIYWSILYLPLRFSHFYLKCLENHFSVIWCYTNTFIEILLKKKSQDQVLYSIWCYSIKQLSQNKWNCWSHHTFLNISSTFHDKPQLLRHSPQKHNHRPDGGTRGKVRGSSKVRTWEEMEKYPTDASILNQSGGQQTNTS